VGVEILKKGGQYITEAVKLSIATRTNIPTNLGGPRGVPLIEKAFDVALDPVTGTSVLAG
jgi:hypothetical protein